MPYAEIQPTAALRPWVECFWSRTDDDAPAGEHRVLPDGCADLVFDLTSGEGMAVGTMTRPLVLSSPARSEYFGVRFRPGRAAAFLRIPLAEITDARVPLREVWGRDVEGGRLVRPQMGRTRRPPSFEDRASLLETELIRRLRPSRDARVDAAVDRIIAGADRVDAIARELGISRQHLARQFQQHVGISPKTFARVMRFRRLLASGDRGCAGLAARHGYYDQSHLIADFRDFAGTTPGAFHLSNP